MKWLQRCSVFVLMAITPLANVLADKLPPATLIYATHDQDWYPIDYRNDDGKWVGVFENQLQTLFVEQLGLDLTIRRQPWNRSQAEVEKGLADILITLPTDERAQFSETVPTPFFSIEFNLLVRKDHPNFDQIADIETVEDILAADLSLVSTHGNGWFESTIKAAGVKTEYVNTDEQQIRFLLAKRADALIDFPLTMKPLLDKLDSDNELKFTEAVFSRDNLHILVSKKSPWIDHLDIINDTLLKTNTTQDLSALSVQP